MRVFNNQAATLTIFVVPSDIGLALFYPRKHFLLHFLSYFEHLPWL